MNLSGARANLKALLESMEKERESLKHVLLSGRISRKTFDLLEKRIGEITFLTLKLEEALREEELSWKRDLLNGLRIFEHLLVELEHKHLLGKIGENEYSNNRRIFSDCLDSIRNQIQRKEESKEDSMAATQQSNGDSAYRKAEDKMERLHSKHEDRNRKNRKRREAVSDSADRGFPEIHCMNPWNPECKNTDIEVSIYYNGRMVPICHRCWKEIANKDVEW